jgi:hypothetical protein
MWVVKRSFLAANIDSRKSTTEIKVASIVVIADARPIVHSEADVQARRVFFTLADGLYWTYEWIFSDACDLDELQHRNYSGPYAGSIVRRWLAAGISFGRDAGQDHAHRSGYWPAGTVEGTGAGVSGSALGDSAGSSSIRLRNVRVLGAVSAGDGLRGFGVAIAGSANEWQAADCGVGLHCTVKEIDGAGAY